MPIRKALLDDVPAIVSLAAESKLSDWPQSDYKAELLRKESIFLASVDTMRQLDGFVIGRLVPGSEHINSVEAEIYNIAVHAENRHRGIGSGLINAFFEACRAHDVQNVRLEVRADNISAQKFYERLGFTAEFIRKAYYHDPVADAIIMRTTL
jgi:ribosomal-protein-alanine N-acetyltransferase